jgi:uncharacterized protein (DUF2249 family)/iron-sulfur cluster repair protein YtfE (RIC family)
MSSTIPLSTDAADAAAVEAIEGHHAQLLGALSSKVEALLKAAARTDRDAAERARRDLADWCERELVPHAAAEEQTLYPAARRFEAGRLLVEAMRDEHVVLTGLVGTLAEQSDPTRTAATGHALRVLFESHMTKENQQLLPLLAAARDVSLAGLLDGMHEAMAGTEHTGGHVGHEPERDHHDCSCGEADDDEPELDTRQVPHAIRHATVFGALDALRPGAALVLVVSHDPLPLLAQLEQRSPGVFAVDYLQRGPDEWRLRLTRNT